MQKYLTFLFCFLLGQLFSQTLVEGYVYESGNRGYLNTVQVLIVDSSTEAVLGEAFSNTDGFFSTEIDAPNGFSVIARKDMFKLKDFKLENLKSKMFVNIVMDRKPGYKFEVTLADKKKAGSRSTDAIKNARIEVYNNTTRKEILKLIDHPEPAFNVNFEQGNHYTILIRKPGYLSKRMEAFVNVEGCILCFEGVGKVQPGVADNLTEGNAMGVLLANVELEPIFEGKTLEIENIYYDLARYDIKKKAREQLGKVILLMDDNPNLSLELGSHTDSRGKAGYNKDLSEKRAKAAVQYMLKNSSITADRVKSRGYGEDIILNKCVDGVQCTEKEHSVNRRTELKILGIGDIHNYKSLADMKREEEIEADLLNGVTEQLEVREGESLEEAIARTESEKDKSVPETNEEGSGSEVLGSVERTLSESQLQSEQQLLLEEEAKQAAKDQKAQLAEKERQAAELLKEQQAEKAESVKDTKEAVEVMAVEIVEDISVDTAVRKANDESTAEVVKEAVSSEKQDMSIDTEVLKRKNEAKAAEVKKPVADQQPTTAGSIAVNEADITNNYLNGHKIVIHKSAKPVSAKHEIFRRHNKLELYYAPDGSIWYLVGGFATREDAQDSFKNFMSVTYPDAYVVTFDQGWIK